MKDLDLTLDYTQLLCISMVYHKFALQNGPKAKYITLVQLSKILELLFHVTDREINRRVVSRIAFDSESSDPKYSGERHCSLASFIKMFAIYFSTNLEKKMHFVFSVNSFSIFYMVNILYSKSICADL